MQNSELEMVHLNDDDLVERSQTGDQQAFGELLRRYRPPCMKLALSMLRNREDAEDEMQTAMWKAYQHIDQFQRDSRFSTWFTRIVVNQCLMRIRSQKRARFLYIDDGATQDDSASVELPSAGSSPEQDLARTELAEVLEKEIRRIPPLLRSVFLLREVHELPMPAVAQQLGISVAAAKSRLLRARTELRLRLQKHTGRLGAGTLMAEA